MSSIFRRYEGNPVLRAADLPYESKLVYNGGVAKRGDEYFMVFRSDKGWSEKDKKAPIFELGLARSSDGINWSVHPHPILQGQGEVKGVYDPRIMLWEDGFLITAAQFTGHGVRG